MSDPWEGRATSDGRAIYRLLEDEFGPRTDPFLPARDFHNPNEPARRA